MKKLRLPENIKLIDESRVLLQCTICKTKFSPNLQPGGKIPRKGKQCPNGCE